MDNQKMKKELGLSSALATVMGTVIGGGAFFKIATITSITRSSSLTLFAWLIAGIITIMAGLSVAELASMYPETGGPIRYLEHTHGKLPSFMLGWAMSIIYYPANIAALSIIFATQATQLLNISQKFIITGAIIVTLSILGLNWLGAKVGGIVQQITLFVKLIPIVVIIIFAFCNPHPINVHLLPITTGPHTNFWTAFGGALLSTMFAYDGWANVGNLAGEMKKPSRDLPLAIIIGLSITTIVYLFLNLSFLKTLPINQIINNQGTAYETATKLMGQFGGKLITAGILVSVYGAINGYMMTGARVPYSLGKNDQIIFSNFFKKLSPKYSVPTNSLIFEVIIAIIMIFMGSFDTLTDMLIYVFWIFSIILFIGVFKLRKNKPELNRPYKVTFYPIPPIIAILGGLFIIVMTTITQPILALTGIALTLLGLPMFFYKNKQKK